MLAWLSSLSFGTILAAAVGAFFANFVAEFVKSLVRKGQLREQNRDEDLKAILRTVDDLQALCETYWSAAAEAHGDREIVLRAHIVSKQQYVLSLVASLLTSKTGKYDADAAFTDVANAMTGGDFGEPARGAEGGRLTEIFNKCLQFRHLVERKRRALKRSFLA